MRRKLSTFDSEKWINCQMKISRRQRKIILPFVILITLTVIGFFGVFNFNKTNVEAATTATLKVGDIIQMGSFKRWDSETGQPMIWRVVGFGPDGNYTTGQRALCVLDNWDTITIQDASGNGIAYQPALTKGSSFRDASGSNDYYNSTIRKWLTADYKSGAYPSGYWNYSDSSKPEYYYTSAVDGPYGINGFMTNFNWAEKDAMIGNFAQKAMINDYDANTLGKKTGGSGTHVYDTTITTVKQNFDTALYKEFTDKVFLLGTNQLQGANSLAGTSGFSLGSGNLAYWLRDAYADYMYYVRLYQSPMVPYISANYNSYALVRLRPATYLTPTLSLNGAGTMANPYTIALQKDIASSDVSVTNIQDFTFTGSAITQPQIIVRDTKRDIALYGNGTHFTVSYTNNVNAGTATMTLTGCGEYYGTKSYTFQINRKSIADTTVSISGIVDKTFTGSPLYQSVVVNDSSRGFNLVENTAYTVGYSNNQEHGTATVTISGIGNYNGTATRTFTINKKPITSTDITVTGITDKTFTGSALEQSPVVCDTTRNFTLQNGQGYTLSYDNNVNVGTATVNINATSSGNYSGTISKTFTINKKSITSSDIQISGIENKSYTGSAITQNVVVYDKTRNFTLQEGQGYTLSYDNNINVGVATVNINATSTGNYSGTASKTFNITKKDLNSTTINITGSYEYNGSAITPTYSVTGNGVTPSDYSVSVTNNVNAGTATLTITATESGNFSGTNSKTFVIEKKPLSNGMLSIAGSYTYTGSKITPSYTVNDDGKIKISDFDVEITNNINAGDATLKVLATADGNYSGSISKTFSIAKKELVGNMISIEGEYTYTGSAINPNFTVSDNEALKASDYTSSVSNNTNAGTATITITGTPSGNYTGSASKDFIINQKDLERSMIEGYNESYVYNGSAINPSISLSYNNNIISSSDYTLTITDNVNVGTATIVITAKDNKNYKGTAIANFAITQRSILNDAEKFAISSIGPYTYKGSEIEPTGFTITDNGITQNKNLTLGKDYTVTYSNNVNAGTGHVIITGKGNYKDSKTFDFTINKLNITSNANIKMTPVDAQLFTGSPIEPTNFDVKYDAVNPNIILSKGIDYTVSYNNNVSKGTGDIVITACGINYEGSKTFNFSIVDQLIPLDDITVTIDNTTIYYDGTEKTPAFTVTLKDVGTIGPDDYSVPVYDNNVNANMYSGAEKAKLYIQLTGSYSSQNKIVEFDILPKELSASDFTYLANEIPISKKVTSSSNYSNVVNEDLNVYYEEANGHKVKLNYTNAIYNGATPLNFGTFDIKLSGLSIAQSETNFVFNNVIDQLILSGKGQIEDGIRPELISNYVSIPDGIYRQGEHIPITLTWDEDIRFKGGGSYNPSFIPTLSFWSQYKADGNIGTLTNNKYLVSGLVPMANTTRSITYWYTVLDGDYIEDGFTFKINEILNSNEIEDLNGNPILFDADEIRINNVKVYTPDVFITKVINTINTTSISNEEKEDILNSMLEDDEITKTIFDPVMDDDLIDTIGEGAINDTLKKKVASYLSNITLIAHNKRDELFSEMRKAISLSNFEDELENLINNPSATPEEIENAKISCEKLSVNQKKNLNKVLYEKLSEKYENLFVGTAYVKENIPSNGEENAIEVFGIISKMNKANNEAIKLNVERILAKDELINLQSKISNNANGAFVNSSNEKLIKLYDITLLKEDNSKALIKDGETILCKITMPISYVDKNVRVYHKINDSTIERITSLDIQEIDNKCNLYFDVSSFSEYFITAENLSITTTVDGTGGTISPVGALTINRGSNFVLTLSPNSNNNCAEIEVLKFEDGTYKKVDVDPINLKKSNTFKLENVDTNYFLTVKFRFEQSFEPVTPSPDDPSSGGGVTMGSSITVSPTRFNAYMQGYNNGTFKPNGTLTRAEAAAIIARLHGDFNESGNYESYAKKYKDYKKDSWMNKYIGYVTSKGLMNGDEKGFRPNDNITRGEFSKIVYLSFKNQITSTGSKKFTDVKGKFYEEYANALYGADILTGYEDGTFRGSKNLTRAEATIMINRASGRKTTDETIKKVKISSKFSDVDSSKWFYKDVLIATNSYID